MDQPTFFFERRSGKDRRSGIEQRHNPRLDLPQRRRRRLPDRRDPQRGLAENYSALLDSLAAGDQRH